MADSYKLRGIADLLIDAATGRIQGYSVVNKFGHNPAVATTGEDVWSGGGTYIFYPDTARVMELLADSSADSVGGAGALTVKVYGLDSNWNDTNEIITVTGSEPAILAIHYKRMYRAIVLTAGSREINAGAIFVRDTATARGNDTALYIGDDDGQTQQAIYTIPAGKTGYFLKGYVSMQNDDKNGVDAEFKWLARLNNGTTGAWATKGQIDLINIGSSWWQYEYGAPAGPLPEKTDIRIRCSKTSDESGAIGGFDLLLIDNDL